MSQILFSLLFLTSIIFPSTVDANEASWMRAIRRDFDDVSLRLEFANWLEKQGQRIRAEFIRGVIELESPSADLEKVNQRLTRLLDDHQEEIAPGLPAHYYQYPWNDARHPIDFFAAGGFVVVASPGGDSLLKDLAEILGDDRSPVVGLLIQERQGTDARLKALFKRKELRRLVRLELPRPAFREAEEILHSENLTKLQQLIFTAPGDAVVSDKPQALALAIASNPAFSHLTQLEFPLWTGTETSDSPRFQRLFHAYLMSDVLSKVKTSPLIAPAFSGSKLSQPAHPARPYISQWEWDRRSEKKVKLKKRTCLKLVSEQ